MQGQGWLSQRFDKALQNGWEIPGYQGLLDEIEPQLDCHAICPTADNVFKAFELLRPDDVEYVILGQDPYWQISKDDAQPIATGLAFGVRQKERPHPATAIYKILRQIYRSHSPSEDERTLGPWAERHKILLLNTALTVPAPKLGENGRKVSAGKHLKYWKKFTNAVLIFLRKKNSHLTPIAWGTKAERSYVEAGFTPIFAYHPTASVKKELRGRLSFTEFWEAKGNCLRW